MKPKEIPDFEINANNNGNLVVHFYEEDFINTEHFATFLDIVDPLLDKLQKKHEGAIVNYHAVSSLRSGLSYLLAGLIENGNLTKDLNDYWRVHSYTKKTKDWQSWEDEAMGLDKFGVYKEKSYKNSYECEVINPCSTPHKAPWLDLDAAPVSPIAKPDTCLGVFGTMAIWQNSKGIRFSSGSLPLNMDEITRLYKTLGQAIEAAKPKVEVIDDDVLI